MRGLFVLLTFSIHSYFIMDFIMFDYIPLATIKNKLMYIYRLRLSKGDSGHKGRSRAYLAM